jgi:hypothetical protein
MPIEKVTSQEATPKRDSSRGTILPHHLKSKLGGGLRRSDPATLESTKSASEVARRTVRSTGCGS